MWQREQPLGVHIDVMMMEIARGVGGVGRVMCPTERRLLAYEVSMHFVNSEETEKILLSTSSMILPQHGAIMCGRAPTLGRICGKMLR